MRRKPKLTTRGNSVEMITRLVQYEGLSNTRRRGIQWEQLRDTPDLRQGLAVYRTGATVEMHPVSDRETFFIVSGAFSVTNAEGQDVLAEIGDYVHFNPGESHGLRCLETGTILITFTTPVEETED